MEGWVKLLFIQRLKEKKKIDFHVQEESLKHGIDKIWDFVKTC